MASLLAIASLRASGATDSPGGTDTATVVVASVELEPGTIVGADQVGVRAVPNVAVPDGAIDDPDRVVGRQVTSVIVAGEPVVRARLAPDGLLGVAAATPPGWTSFALPADDRLPPTVVGQDVQLFALPPATDVSRPGHAADRLTDSAVVVAVDDRRVTVAVDARDAPHVAAALVATTVVLAVRGP